MAGITYGAFHSLMQKLASSRFGAWYFSKTQQPLDALVLKLTGTRTATSLLAGLPVIFITARGAKTGQPRTVPLLCIRDEQDPTEVALVATNWGQRHYPSWYFNLKTHPEASGAIDGKTKTYLAHEAEGEVYARYWQRAMETYLGFPKYQQRIGDSRQIPIMVLREKESAL